MKTPYSYQAQHLQLWKEKQISRLPLFWQMRVGKSPAIIWWILQHEPRPLRVLIVCPKSVIVSWKEELIDFKLPHLVFSTADRDIQDGLANVTTYNPDHYPWIITNYECLTAKNMRLHEQPWDAVILDESTKLMNPTTKISKLITHQDSFPLRTPNYEYDSPLIPARRPQLRACLAGKPNPESDLNFFQQFKFLYGGMGKIHNYWEFRKKFFYTSAGSPGKYIPRPGTTKAVAKYLSHNAYILTRRTLGKDLPSVYEKRYVFLSERDRKIYTEFERSWFSEFLNDLLKEGLQGKTPAQLETKFATVAQAHLHQMACGFPKHTALAMGYQGQHKLDELISLLEEDLYDEKVVIWCRYLNDIEAITKKIKDCYLKDKLPTQAQRLQGGMTTRDIEQTLLAFRADREKAPLLASNYLVCQVNKAAMGMNLSIADTQIFFSRSWSHLVNDQAKDRLVHPSKLSSSSTPKGILTLDIITQNTVDEDLHNALIDKKASSSIFKYFLDRTKFQFNFEAYKETVQ